MQTPPVLIIGEICIDFSLKNAKSQSKMRLGGIVHAARGLWACDIPYAVAAICPDYLEDQAKHFLEAHGCVEFIKLGSISGAPNVFIIGDVKETGDQGYENLLRDDKKVELTDIDGQLNQFSNVILFPGTFPIKDIFSKLSEGVKVTIDIAYDIEAFADLESGIGKIHTIATSTSSPLFQKIASVDVAPLVSECKNIGAKYFLLKENRGGSRFYNLENGKCEEIPAILGETANSVGVGDVYTAVLAATPDIKLEDAVWRGMQAATKYAQTTFPDDLRRNTQRELKVSIEDIRLLGGVLLPWHERIKYEIYLAAPDFTYVDRERIEAAVSALKYHNFKVRRPVTCSP